MKLFMLRERTSKEEVAFREMLRDRRKDLGLRQADLALRLGKPQSFVSKYESGERLLTFVEAIVIFKVLSLDIADVAKVIISSHEAKS
jgi:transcriptional regulator with XRE-family HTH domain